MVSSRLDSDILGKSFFLGVELKVRLNLTFVLIFIHTRLSCCLLEKPAIVVKPLSVCAVGVSTCSMLRCETAAHPSSVTFCTAILKGDYTECVILESLQLLSHGAAPSTGTRWSVCLNVLSCSRAMSTGRHLPISAQTRGQGLSAVAAMFADQTSAQHPWLPLPDEHHRPRFHH